MAKQCRKSCTRGPVLQGYEARLAELGLSNCQHTFLEVNIITLQADRLGQAHARNRDKSEQMVIGPAAQSIRWRQGQRRRQQRVDLPLTIDIGLRSLPLWKDPCGRHLRLRIDACDMSRETAHVDQAPGCRRVLTGWQGRPCQRQLRRDGRALRLSMKVTKSRRRPA